MLIANVDFLGAFIAGFVSFISPCILPLIPIYIMYITGTVIEENLKEKKLLSFTRSIGFVIGFSIVYILLGLSSGFVGGLLVKNKLFLTRIGGIIIIVFGLTMLDVFKIKFSFFQSSLKISKNNFGWFGSILMGMVFAIGITPCSGAVLGTILIYAGASSTAIKGMLLLAVYSIGMAVPFLLTSIFINSFNKLISKANKAIIYIYKISGIFIIVFGLIMLFDKINNVSNWLARILLGGI